MTRLWYYIYIVMNCKTNMKKVTDLIESEIRYWEFRYKVVHMTVEPFKGLPTTYLIGVDSLHNVLRNYFSTHMSVNLLSINQCSINLSTIISKNQWMYLLLNVCIYRSIYYHSINEISINLLSINQILVALNKHCLRNIRNNPYNWAIRGMLEL